MPSTVLWYAMAVAAAGAAAVLVLYFLGLGDECPVEQIGIETGLQNYHRSPDPELCAGLNERISGYDARCGGEIETLDCG